MRERRRRRERGHCTEAYNNRKAEARREGRDT